LVEEFLRFQSVVDEMVRQIRVNKDKCSGCRYCELICSYRESLRFNPRDSKIRVAKYDERGIDKPVLCRQCVTCPPIDACPTSAFRRGDGGVVRIDAESCMSCYLCVDACTVGAVFRPRVEGPPLVCDLCGGKPSCVEKCPTRALTFADEDASLGATPNESEVP